MSQRSLTAATLAAMQANAPNVQNGTYTVDSPRGHFTVKLYTVQKDNLAGNRILALLVGPDNESDYRGVAFWDDAKKRAHVWKRFGSPDRTEPIDGYHWGDRWSSVEQKLAIWADLALRGSEEERHGHWYGNGYRLLMEGRCVVCNRKLTDPESIRLGIGPTCAGRFE